MSIGTTRTARTPFVVPTDPEAHTDYVRLCTALVKLLQVDLHQLTKNPMYLALILAGFIGFNNDFIHLTPDNIDKLTYEHEVTTPVPAAPQPTKKQQKVLMITRSNHHHQEALTLVQ